MQKNKAAHNLLTNKNKQCKTTSITRMLLFLKKLLGLRGKLKTKQWKLSFTHIHFQSIHKVKLSELNPCPLYAAGSRAPGPSAQCLVVVAGRIAVCFVWRTTPMDSSPRWRSGSAPTPLYLSLDRFATPSPALSGWQWSGLRSVSIYLHQASIH